MNINKKFETIVKELISKKYGFPNSDIVLSPFDFIDEDQEKVFSIVLKINVVDTVTNHSKEMSESEANRKYGDFGTYKVGESIYIDENSLFNSEWLNETYIELSKEYSHDEISTALEQYDIVYIPKDDIKVIDSVELIKRIKSIYERDDWLNVYLQGEMSWLNQYLVSSKKYQEDDMDYYEYVFNVSDGFIKLYIAVYGEDGISHMYFSRVEQKEIVQVIYEDIGEKVNIV